MKFISFYVSMFAVCLSNNYCIVSQQTIIVQTIIVFSLNSTNNYCFVYSILSLDCFVFHRLCLLLSMKGFEG